MSIEAERKAERIPPTAFAAARCSYSEILNPAYSVSVLVCREMIPALYEACGVLPDPPRLCWDHLQIPRGHLAPRHHMVGPSLHTCCCLCITQEGAR